MRFLPVNNTPQTGKCTLILYSIAMARATKFLDAVLSFLDHGKDRQTNCPMVRLAHCRRGYKNRQGQ